MLGIDPIDVLVIPDNVDKLPPVLVSWLLNNPVDEVEELAERVEKVDE